MRFLNVCLLSFLAIHQPITKESTRPQESPVTQQRKQEQTTPSLPTQGNNQSLNDKTNRTHPEPQDWLYRTYLISGPIVGIIALGTGILVWRQIIALRRIERAWLLVTDVEYTEYPEVVKRDERRISGAYFAVKNYGKSPAWIASIGGSFVTINSLADLPPKPAYQTIKDVKDKGIVIVPMTVEEDDYQVFKFPHESNSDINDAEFQRAIHQTILWCVYGFVTYRDIFNEERETRFCYVMTSGRRRWQPVDAGPLYTYHK